MAHPIPQTPEELLRECVGTIWHAADDISKAAERRDIPAIRVHFDFLKVQMGRLETIQKTVRPQRREL